MRQPVIVSACCAVFLAVVVYVFLPDVVAVSAAARLVFALLGGLAGALVASAAYAQRRPA